MLQKQVLLVWVCVITAVSLFLLPGCGKQKTKTVSKSSNIAINPSFEAGKIFNSRLHKKGESSVEKPVGWTTKGQILNDSSAWVSDEARTGNHSLKIENIGGTDAYWEGKPIIFKKNANAFEASIWTKAKKNEKDTGKGKFQLALNVYFKGANDREFKVKTVNLDISQTNNTWEKTFKKILVTEKISRIVPRLYFSGKVGTVWFDDISVKPYTHKWKILFDSNIKNIFIGKLKIISDKNKEKTYEVTGAQQIMSADFISVKSDKTYKLSGMFKSMANEKSRLYFGFIPYDKNKRIINNHSVMYRKNTETELAVKCSKDDKVIFVKDASSWIKSPSACIAFDVDISGKYSDLPNFNHSSIGIKKISKSGESWKIELLKPCRRSYPANTKIREHIPVGSGTYIYSAANNIKIPNTWTEYKEIIHKDNKGRFKKFHLGTKYVKLFMLANFQQSRDISLDFKNIKLKEFN